MITKKTTDHELRIFNQIPRYLKKKSLPKLQITQPLPPERLPSWPPRCRTNPKWLALSAAAQGAWWWGQLRVQPRPTEAVLLWHWWASKSRLQGSSDVSTGKAGRNPFFLIGPQERHFSATDGLPLHPPSSIARKRIWFTMPPNQPHVQVQGHHKVRFLANSSLISYRKGLISTKPIPTMRKKKKKKPSKAICLGEPRQTVYSWGICRWCFLICKKRQDKITLGEAWHG